MDASTAAKNQVTFSAGQHLTTMDTNTKVTNSPLASGNPTPAPCCQGVSTLHPSTMVTHTMQVAQISPTTQLVVGNTKAPNPSVIHGPTVPNLLEALSQRIPTPVNVPESQTFPRSLHDHSLQHVLNRGLRPILLSNNQTATLNRIHSSQQAGQKYQIIAYPAGATNLQQPNQKPVLPAASVQNQTAPQQQMSLRQLPHSSGGVVLSNFISAPEISANDASSNAARITQLLSPVAIPTANLGSGSQFVLYYPPTTNAVAGKATSIPSNDENLANQQPTIYYAVATSDILKQLQTTSPVETVQHHPQQQTSKQLQQQHQQIIQTPNGLILLQPHMTNSLKLPVMQARKPLPQAVECSNVIVNTTRSVDGVGHSGAGLICTCPPEVHQAIFEQQRKQKLLWQQQQQQKSINQPQTSPQDRQIIPTTKTIPTAQHIQMDKCQTKLHENGVSKTLDETITQDPSKIGVPNSGTCPSHRNNQKPHSNLTTTDEKSIHGDAHVNYLITLFQALKSSGVHPAAFVAAFERTEIPIPSSTHLKKQLESRKTELKECQQSISTLRVSHEDFKQQITESLQSCRTSAMHLLKQNMLDAQICMDPLMRTVRTDRATLDQTLVSLADARTSLVEQIHDLECVIEQTGNDVLQHRCHITVPYVQTLDCRLDSINRSVGSACVLYPEIRQQLADQENEEAQLADRIEKSMDEQLHQLEDIGEKCKRIKGTISTLRRLAIVNGQNRQQSTSPRRFSHLGGIMNRAAADAKSLERTRLYASISAIQVDSEKRMQAIKRQEILTAQRKRVLTLEAGREFQCTDGYTVPMTPTIAISELLRKSRSRSTRASTPTTNTNTNHMKVIESNSKRISPTIPEQYEEKKAPLAVYSDDSLSSTTTTSSAQIEQWGPDFGRKSKSLTPFNPSTIISMIDESSDGTMENQSTITFPMSILKAPIQTTVSNNHSPKPTNKIHAKPGRGVMFNTTVTVDDGSEVLRLNCTLDEAELGQHKVATTDKLGQTADENVDDKLARGKLLVIDPTTLHLPNKPGSKSATGNHTSYQGLSNGDSNSLAQKQDGSNSTAVASVPAPPPRRSSQITNPLIDSKSDQTKGNSNLKTRDHEMVDHMQRQNSPQSDKRILPLSISNDVNAVPISPID